MPQTINNMISPFETESKRLRLDDRTSNFGMNSLSNAQRTCKQVPLVKQVWFANEDRQPSQQHRYLDEMDESISLESDYSSSIMSNNPGRKFSRRNSQTAAMMVASTTSLTAGLNTHRYQRRNSVVETMLFPMTKESISMEKGRPALNGQDSISSLVSETEKSGSFITDEWKEEEQLRHRLRDFLGP